MVWLSADEYEADTAEGIREMVADALADRLRYDPENEVRKHFDKTHRWEWPEDVPVYQNDSFWYAQTEEERDYSGERG